MTLLLNLLFLPSSISVTNVKAMDKFCRAHLPNCVQSVKEKENSMNVTNSSKDCTNYFSTDKALSKRKKILLNSLKSKKSLSEKARALGSIKPMR